MKKIIYFKIQFVLVNCIYFGKDETMVNNINIEKIFESLEYKPERGLVVINDKPLYDNVYESLYIYEIQNIDPDIKAVLFRRYYKNNEANSYKSEPSVCIFEKPDYYFNSEEHKKLHAKLWSSGKNEIYIIIGQTSIDIINARRPAEVNKSNELSMESLRLASESIELFNNTKFHVDIFNKGIFWEQSEFQNKVSISNSPFKHLLDNLDEARKKLLSKIKDEIFKSAIDKLLVTSILIKFLEEIKDDDENYTLKEIYTELGIDSFITAIKEKKVVLLFEKLANQFNGKIFDKFTGEEKEYINSSDFDELIEFLEAKTQIKSGQKLLWEQFDFKFLPIEIISVIYESFIQSENEVRDKGVVYTPIFLVDFLVDEVMPLSDYSKFKNESFKVLDPTCGSGVFLVAAYKRLLQWWVLNNYEETNEIKYPNAQKAIELLENNIFGVDTNPTAVLVSIFSLTTAILEKLSPKEVWHNLKFRDIEGKNIIRDDFFTWACNATKDFDLVIGNPPFNPESGKSKSDILIKEKFEQIGIKHQKIPGRNFALHFFETSIILGKRICLILPAQVLLYNDSDVAISYRKDVLTDFSISKLFDFTHLRRELFDNADTPVIAIIAENKNSSFQNIEHIIVKRTNLTNLKIRFEIDHYDRHLVRWDWATNENFQFIWKTNLLGGGQLFSLIYRFQILAKFKEYLKQKKDKLIFQRGFEGNGENVLNDVTIIKKIIEDDNVFKLIKQENTSITFNNLKDNILYIPPFIVFTHSIASENINTLKSFFVDSDKNNNPIYFPRNFIGLTSKSKNKKDLSYIFNRLCSPTTSDKLNYNMFLYSTSSSCLIEKENTISQKDIENLPFPENEDYLKLSENEQIIQSDVLNYYIHLGKAISEGGGILHNQVTKEDLEAYGNVFCNELNETYENVNEDGSIYKWEIGKVKRTKNFTIYKFQYGIPNNMLFDDLYSEIDELDQELINVVYNDKQNKSALYVRVAKYYEHSNNYDCIYYIKPNTIRYWLKSIALRDVDDTVFELMEAGY